MSRSPDKPKMLPADQPATDLLLTDPDVQQKVSEAVAIFGITRSGTTIVGKLVHSCRNVEYAFEPDLLRNLFLLRNQMPSTVWQALYTTVLYEGILIGSLSGRALNFNQNDDSCIFSAKPADEIAQRFVSGSSRHRHLVSRCAQATVAYKLPNVMGAIPFLKQLYPKTRVLVMLRHPDAVVLSLLRKGWFKNRIPTYRETGKLKQVGASVVPAVVDNDLAEEWAEADEISRCYMLYLQCYKNLARGYCAAIIDYDNFVAAPRTVFGKACKVLSLVFGQSTDNILDTIREAHSSYPVPEGVNVAKREEALHLYQELRQYST